MSIDVSFSVFSEVKNLINNWKFTKIFGWVYVTHSGRCTLSEMMYVSSWLRELQALT